MYKELLVGCGNRRHKDMGPYDRREFENLVTLDMSEDCKPDIVHDLNDLPYPFKDNEFDEIHAYDVLEHVGQQGDYRHFFAEFSEYWRILKKDGWMFISVPKWGEIFEFGDPGHTRSLSPGNFVYLSQKEYERQIGQGKMTDYRSIYKRDFNVVRIEEYNETQINVYLQVVK